MTNLPILAKGHCVISYYMEHKGAHFTEKTVFVELFVGATPAPILSAFDSFVKKPQAYNKYTCGELFPPI